MGGGVGDWNLATAYRALQKREKTGKEYGFFRLFEKLRYSNER